MNEVNFCNSFLFNIFRFDNYHFTDHTKEPIPKHYFGCLVKGKCILKSEDIQLTILPGEIFYIPKGLKYQSHWFGNNEDKIEFYSFGFDIAPTKDTFILQKVQCSPKAEELFEELCTQIPFSEKGIGMLYHFFGEAAEQMQRSSKSRSNPTVEKAIAYITHDPNAKNTQVAAHCNVCESALYALFKKHIGKTPNDLRLDILCEQAVTLLSTTNRSVQEISDSLGFSSTSYFRKILRKHTGKTPLEIRKESVF